MSTTSTQLGRVVLFRSTKPGLRLIRQSQGERIMPNGTVVPDPTMPEVDYQFQALGHSKMGVLEVREGQDLMEDALDPQTGQPVARDAVTYLRSHDWFGTTIKEAARDEGAPDPGPLYAQIAQLAAKGDIDALVALGDEEHATWGREQVLAAIGGALEQIQPPPKKAA